MPLVGHDVESLFVRQNVSALHPLEKGRKAVESIRQPGRLEAITLGGSQISALGLP